MSFAIKDKVGLVTGGAQGIGFCCATKLLENGAKGVTIADVNVEQGSKSLQELQKKYGENSAIFVKTDVCNEEQFKEAIEATIKKWGSIDILMNNAGVLSEQDWKRGIDINSGGVVRGTYLGLQYMGKNHGKNGGVIINTASIAGIIKYPVVPIYTATKHFVIAFTRCTGNDLHYDQTGVRVLAICPGITDTSILDRFSDPDFGNIGNAIQAPSEAFPDHSTKQPVKNVGNAVMSLIRKAPTGTIWVSMDNEPPFEVEEVTQLIPK